MACLSLFRRKRDAYRNICKQLVSKCAAPSAVPCTQALLLCLSRVIKPFLSVYLNFSHVLTDRRSRKKVHLTTSSQPKDSLKALCKSPEEESMSVSVFCCLLMWHPLWDHKEKKSFDGSKCLVVLWCFLLMKSGNQARALKANQVLDGIDLTTGFYFLEHIW